LLLHLRCERLSRPPDGGYPGFNTAEGQNALFNLTTGVGNTAVGWVSLWSDTDGSYNTAVGAGTLLFNVGNLAELKSVVENLAATVNQQASQLQKVNAQLQINNTPTQLVEENP
jgi:hypothetical protein